MSKGQEQKIKAQRHRGPCRTSPPSPLARHWRGGDWWIKFAKKSESGEEKLGHVVTCPYSACGIRTRLLATDRPLLTFEGYGSRLARRRAAGTFWRRWSACPMSHCNCLPNTGRSQLLHRSARHQAILDLPAAIGGALHARVRASSQYRR